MREHNTRICRMELVVLCPCVCTPKGKVVTLKYWCPANAMVTFMAKTQRAEMTKWKKTKRLISVFITRISKVLRYGECESPKNLVISYNYIFNNSLPSMLDFLASHGRAMFTIVFFLFTFFFILPSVICSIHH